MMAVHQQDQQENVPQPKTTTQMEMQPQTKMPFFSHFVSISVELNATYTNVWVCLRGLHPRISEYGVV